MVKLIAIFRRPADPQEWMGRYLNEHEPLCRALPGLVRLELSSPFESMPLAGAGGDRRGPPFLICELYFADRASFDAAMTSPEGRTLVVDLERVGQVGLTMYLADVERDHAPPRASA